MASTEHFMLYYNKWSICSQMVQLKLAFRGHPRDVESAIVLEGNEVDIMPRAQYEETLLTEINPKEQVPVLTHPTILSKPIADSLDIAYYIATQYPDLIPENNKEHVIKLRKELHSMNYFSLSFRSKPEAAKGQKLAIEEKLGQTGISDTYRKALEYKMTIVQNKRVGGVTPAEIGTQTKNARIFLERVAKVYDSANGSWLWARTTPTTFDVHLGVFLARLHNFGLTELVPKHLAPLYSIIIETKEWQGVFEGQKTMFGV